MQLRILNNRSATVSQYPKNLLFLGVQNRGIRTFSSEVSSPFKAEGEIKDCMATLALPKLSSPLFCNVLKDCSCGRARIGIFSGFLPSRLAAMMYNKVASLIDSMLSRKNS